MHPLVFIIGELHFPKIYNYIFLSDHNLSVIKNIGNSVKNCEFTTFDMYKAFDVGLSEPQLERIKFGTKA